MAQEKDVYVIIIAGGIGSRLWPLSRRNHPKQFLSLFGDKSLIQNTYDRAQNLAEKSHIFITAPQDYAPLIEEYLPDFPMSNLLGEPSKKGTTAAFGYAATRIHQLDPDAILHIIAADDFINDINRYSINLKTATFLARSNQEMVIFGVKPRYPHTGYGYIQVDSDGMRETDGTKSYPVKLFHEKPELETAKRYASSPDYFWHVFGFTISTRQLLNLIRDYAPVTHQVLLEIAAELKLNPKLDKSVLKAYYDRIEEVNIENQVLEKLTLPIHMVALEENWSDVGSWSQVHEVSPKDDYQNAKIHTQSDVMSQDSTGNLIVGNTKLIALVGTSNLAVVETADVLLICDMKSSQGVKKIVESLKNAGKNKYL